MTEPSPRTNPTMVAPRLDGRVVSRERLDSSHKAAMFGLLDAHFVGVDREIFESDLSGKNWVILLEDEDGTLRGFSTLAVYQSLAPGRPVIVVYSGDTIVERPWWGSPTLARTWIHSVREVAPAGARDIYWLLLTSGYRTYRFLPVFFRTFCPRPDGLVPAEETAVLAALARERFGDLYDADRGVVRFAKPQVLRTELLSVPDGRLLDPHVALFLDMNPGFVLGDELVCLTRIHDDNLTAAGRRMARGGPAR